MTELLYRADAYARGCAATVLAVTERGGVVLDKTVFYAASGGQPGDAGSLSWPGGSCVVATAVYEADKATVAHVPAEAAALPPVGSQVEVGLDWALRHRHMRMHTALHLLCSLVRFPVTGGQIGADEGRLDFDIPTADAIDKDTLEAELNALVSADHPISERWITDEELAASPGLVRTMSVKPPTGSGRVRLVAIGVDGAIDLQPCGGTHVRATGEIGRLAVTKIEKKGKQNRRVRIAFA